MEIDRIVWQEVGRLDESGVFSQMRVDLLEMVVHTASIFGSTLGEVQVLRQATGIVAVL